ncbi:MAG: winged helix-turn-helix domain-containing protein [Pseudobdellovibrionaceae bacterium]
METLERQLELGFLYSDRGDFTQALDFLNQAVEGFFQNKNYTQYLKCLNRILRIYAEREDFEKINQTKERLQDLVLKEGFELNSKTYYTLGICARYKGQTDSALDYFQKALTIALAQDNKEDICSAIFGIAGIYSRPEVARYTDALKEIYNLEVFFQVYSLPELRVSALMLNADILFQMKKYEEAVDVLWKAYDLLKEVKNLTTSIYLLAMMANIYFELGEKDLARMYISMAQKSLDLKNHVRLGRIVKAQAEKIGATQNNFDLVFDEENHAVIEKKMGKVDFKNQFILLDLLKLFMLNQGVVYTKEYLVENVWRQAYDPSVHDNKIYVTIKRLRKLIEPDFEKPKYIFRAKNGYYMNKAARVQIEH